MSTTINSPKTQIIRQISEDDLKFFCETSKTWKEVAIKCGYTTATAGDRGCQLRLRKKIIKLQIPHSHLDKIPTDHLSEAQISTMLQESTSWHDFIVEKMKFRTLNKNYLALVIEVLGKLGLSYDHLGEFVDKDGKKVSPTRQRCVLERRLQESGRLEICEWCRCEAMDDFDNGKWIWCGRPLTLEIDHIHGKGFPGCDEPWNLRYLCPTCHGQTSTHTHNTSYRQKGEIKRKQLSYAASKLKKANVPYVCSNCNCKHYTWEDEKWNYRGWPLVLEANHIHGRRVDADSCEWLCKNCHAQHTTENQKARQDENRARKKQRTD